MLIESYRASWVENFNSLKRVLEEALADLPISLEHVGSTAVPGLAAKPLIDIDLIFDQRLAFDIIKSRLSNVGYHHNGNQGIPGRDVFKRSQTGNTQTVLDVIPHHLYVCPVNSDELQKHCLFRDYLIANEDARVHYQNLKYEIAKEANQDRKRYAQLKELKATAYISSVVEKARLERMRFPLDQGH